MSVARREHCQRERRCIIMCEEASRKLITACEYFQILTYLEMEVQEVSTTAARTRGGLNLQLRNTRADFTFKVKPREADKECVWDPAALFHSLQRYSTSRLTVKWCIRLRSRRCKASSESSIIQLIYFPGACRHSERGSKLSGWVTGWFNLLENTKAFTL